MRTAILRPLRRMLVLGSLALAACSAGAAPPEAPLQRVKVDDASGRVWVLTADEVVLYQEGLEQKTRIALPGWLWAGGAECAPDLALGPAGEAIVTSNVVPVLWKVDPKTLAVSVHRLALDADADKDVGFSGLVYSQAQSSFYAVSGMHGSLWQIDHSLRKAQKIQLAAPAHKACAQPIYSRAR